MGLYHSKLSKRRIMFISIVVIVLGLSTVVNSQCLCPAGYKMSTVTNDQSCYQFHSDLATHEGAELICQLSAPYGHLASIGNSAVNQYLDTLATTNVSNIDQFWTGLITVNSSNYMVPGNWHWTDRQKVLYQNWGLGFPQANGTGCMVFKTSNNAINQKKWSNDYRCDQTAAFFCRVSCECNTTGNQCQQDSECCSNFCANGICF